jgi:hypothetical protein
MTMSPRHTLVLAAAILATGSVLTHARQQPPPARQPGLYLAKADGSVVRLTLQTPNVETKGMAKAIFSQGIMGPSTEAHLNGAHADEQIAPGVATFYLHLSSSRDPMSRMGEDVPMQVTSGRNVVLIRLKAGKPEDDERVADLGRAGSSKPKNIVEWTTTKLSATAFKLETKAPLEAGEYAVTTVPVLSGEMWDFGVK